MKERIEWKENTLPKVKSGNQLDSLSRRKLRK